jgi:hypothetical protein
MLMTSSSWNLLLRWLRSARGNASCELSASLRTRSQDGPDRRLRNRYRLSRFVLGEVSERTKLSNNVSGACFTIDTVRPRRGRPDYDAPS